MSEKERRYRDELKRLESMFGLTFSDKEREKIINNKIKKEQERNKNVK